MDVSPDLPALVLLALYAAALLAFALVERRKLLGLLIAVGRPAAYFAVASVLLLVLAQVFPPGRALYPYAAWTMYTYPAPSAAAWDFTATRTSGAESALDIRQSVRGPDPRPIFRRLYRRAGHLTSGDPLAEAHADAELAAILGAFVRLDARRVPDDPIEAVTLRRCRLEGAPPWSRESLACGAVLGRWTFGAGAFDAP